ncbi:nitrile hydratase subunit beta [Stappia sp. F7233]|uniref:Nitrile hydratase subunit beta n=1 Tax=Stappia albiluteola TaxID=2758565 RepID=A0A839AFT3_9HYPH|nr:SH3-like domain-containing protein [Stappia albiluteola]MBA5778511.1 nitrile hydratase subunit beta [Stappia albiluteola]
MPVTPDMIPGIIATNFSPMAEVADAPAFKVGDKVNTKIMAKPTHTRLPRYLRGRVGTVVTYYGGFVFADTRAILEGDHPQHLYCIRFEGSDIWGPDAGPKDVIYADLYESYLEKA